MAEELSIELHITVNQKAPVRIRPKDVKYFKLNRMTFVQYHAATEIIVAGMSAIAEKLLELGYDMTALGEKLTKDSD